MTNKPVRLVDIARIARVHETTVSLALRDSPNLADSTREKIKSIAEKLGYRANPAFHSLANYSQHADYRRPKVFYVTDEPLDEVGVCGFSQEPYFQGSRRYLSLAGFQLEPLIYPTALALHEKITESGSAGLLIGSLTPHFRGLPALFSDKVAAVKIGAAIPGFSIPAVLEDATSTMRIAMQQARKHDAERVGFVISSHYDSFAGGDWHSSYLRSQIEARESHPIPALLAEDEQSDLPTDQERGNSRNLAELQAWIARWKPDCVIGFTERTRDDIQRLGYKIPSDLMYIQVFAQADSSGTAGLYDQRQRVGEVAADLLVRTIRSHRDSSMSGTKTVVEAHWKDGDSLIEPATFDVEGACFVDQINRLE